MTPLRIAIVSAAVLAIGCSEPVETPTSATTTGPTTILFSGTLQPRGTRFYSYTVTTAGTVSALLASLERGYAPMPNALELGIGVPAGTGCAVQTVVLTTSALVPQIRQDSAVGTYCVRVSDTGGLPAAMNFTIRVIHP